MSKSDYNYEKKVLTVRDHGGVSENSDQCECFEDNERLKYDRQCLVYSKSVQDKSLHLGYSRPW